MTVALNPLNDCVLLATIKVPDDTGKLVPLDTGSASAFLATSDASTATPADPTLVGTVVYTGAGGKWLVRFDGATLDPALLASLFATAAPFAIVVVDGDIRAAIPLAYADARRVEVRA